MEGSKTALVVVPGSLSKAKYTKRWKGKDGKWQYSYDKPGSKGSKKGTGKTEPLSGIEAWKAEKNLGLAQHYRGFTITPYSDKAGGETRYLIEHPELEPIDGVYSLQEARDTVRIIDLPSFHMGKSLSKSSHHPAGTSKVNAGIKSPIPYEGHEERMKLAQMAAMRMLGAGTPESAKEYTGKPVVDHKGREKGQKPPHDNYGTSVSGMGSQAHDIYGKPTFLVKPSELGSGTPESASKYTPVTHTPAPKKR